MIPTSLETAAAIDSGLWTFVPKVEWAPAGTTDWRPLDVISGSFGADRTAQTRFTFSGSVMGSGDPTGRGVEVGPLGIHPYGCLVRCYIGVKPLRSDVEYLSAGLYSVTGVARDNKSVQLTCSSQEVEIQGANFPVPRNLPDWGTYSYRQQAEILIKEALPSARIYWNSNVSNTELRMPPVSVDRDRWAALSGKQTAGSIANALGADLYCDRSGAFVFESVPSLLNSEPKATLANDSYVVSSTINYDRNSVYNLIVVTGQATDGQTQIGPIFAWDANPASLTYAGPDPVHQPHLAGGYGVKPFFYNSAMLTTPTLAYQAAQGILANAIGVNQTLAVNAKFDPRIEVGDAIWVESPNSDQKVLAIVDKLSYNLESGGVSITTRSSNGIAAGIAAQV